MKMIPGKPRQQRSRALRGQRATLGEREGEMTVRTLLVLAANRAIARPLARIELAGCSFGSVLWARVECDFRARCCLMDGVDHHLE